MPKNLISDTERIEAMIRNGWRIAKRRDQFRIKGLTEWMDCPRAVVDRALAMEAEVSSAKAAATIPSISVTEDDEVWHQWETRFFPAETKRSEIIAIARVHGWAVSIVQLKGSGVWRAMAMYPVKRR